MLKKTLFLLLLLFLSVLNAEWVDIEGNSGKNLFEHTSSGKEYTEVNFSLNGYNIETIRENEIDYQKISYWKEGNSLQVGKPDLPKFTRLISIPNEGSVSFEIIYTEDEIVKDISIYPTQELQSENNMKPFKFIIDEDYYQNGYAFPTNIVEIGEPVILRDQRVVSISINPFQYDPQTKTLRIVRDVDIVVNASGKGGINPKILDKKRSRFFEPLYRSTILNYDSVRERNGEYQNPSYLFIYPDDATLLSNLEYLSDWKHQKGFDVTLASTAETGTTNTSIKNYIQNAYDNWENPPEFVCLVGDVGGSYDIPTFYITYYSAEGDHPYAQLEGNDVLEDIFIGRISISSIADLQTYIVKVLNYEKEPYMDETGWYNTSLMVGDPSISGPSTVFINQSIVEMMQQHAPNIVATEVYSGSFSSLMTSNLNSGVSYFNYRGWLNMSGFGNTDINNLTNYKKLPFAVFLTCSTGGFASGESRSEAFIRAGSASNPTGAIAAIGTATTGTHTNFNNCIDAGIYYGVFVDNIYNPGGAVNRGKLALYEHYPQNPDGHVDNFSHMNTLIGDPGVELWTGIPRNLFADYETQISPGTNYLEVTVINIVEAPLEGAWVTAYMDDDEIFATGFTDETGFIALPIDADAEGTANLTVTKHNYIPHLGGFDVGEIDRFVNVFNVMIDDDISGTSTGNDDGVINPGEAIELKVSLKNFGSQTANSVTATITTDNNFVTITDDVEDFGSILSGNSAYCIDDFDISIDEDVLGGTEIKIDIVIEDNIRNSWNDIIFLVVEGANLDVVDYTIDDANGYLDPGETVEMNVTIQNNGLVTANAVSGILSSTDSRVTVSDVNGYFGTITGEGGQASNTADTFEVAASTQLVVGTQIMMELHLYNADGYDSTVQFILGIGEVSITDPVGPDAYGYFCYDDGDTGYLSVPTYEWIEINSIGTNLNLSDPGDDGDSETINSLPITFRMYGEEYDSATVCSNGWIAPGGSTQASFMNSPIPGPQGPSPMIAPFWDDLKTGSGGVYWYHDSSLHTVIIEWDNMQNDYNNDEETFQVILYDANYYPTTTGDSEIKLQYKIINNTNSGSYPSQHGQYSSVGIEDPTGTIGLEYTFNNSYPDAAKHLQNEMALLITSSPIPLEEPFLVLGDIRIIDENDNGQVDHGEDVDLDITLNNLGEETATGVSAVLSTSDIYITITANSSNYNDISGGGSGENLTDYEFTVVDTCPDGHIISFQLDVISNEDNWDIVFELEVNAPKIEYDNVFIDDGDNHMLDPGETTDILVTFTNNGGTDAYLTSAFISTDDIYLTINSATFDFGTFQSGQSEIAVFNVTADASAPIGHSAVIDWDVAADYSYSAEDSFSISIGIITEDFETGNFSANPWGFAGDADWTVVTEAPYEGTYCAKSGIITHNQTSELILNAEVTADGTISFYRKVSSESVTHYYDGLKFFIDGVEQDRWNGEVAWSQVSYPVSAGNRTFKWEYEKDGSISHGSDCAWVDYIIFPASYFPEPADIIVSPLLFEKTLQPGNSSSDVLTIGNTGGTTLDYTARIVYLERNISLENHKISESNNSRTDYSSEREIKPYIIAPLIKEVPNADFRDCTFTIDLYDDYGDGWNDGSLDVMVNSLVVLDDITLTTGSGPVSFDISISTGDSISTTFTAGNWAYENSYFIYDNDGVQVASDGTGGIEPTGLSPFAVTCMNDPTLEWLTLNGQNQISGSIDPGSPDDVLSILFDTLPDSLTEGIYEANIQITSNDPDESSIIVPVTLTVSLQLASPVNVQIQLNGSSIQLSWDAVTGAVSYKVYSSNDPYTGFVEDTSGSFAGESWSTSVIIEKKFYRVTAEN
ncbi:MAG: hypothetical protein K8R49_02545 [Candidatus Cloacimonetes bacterium]|nr:hypothetical protein [Candidatus Cloacimonadota bacterium]